MIFTVSDTTNDSNICFQRSLQSSFQYCLSCSRSTIARFQFIYRLRYALYRFLAQKAFSTEYDGRDLLKLFVVPADHFFK